MKRLAIGLLGLILLGAGAFVAYHGQPEQGAYRYPAEPRAEAREFARTIKDREARRRFLEETTGRIRITHPGEIFAGGLLAAVGAGLAIAALRPVQRRPVEPSLQTKPEAGATSRRSA